LAHHIGSWGEYTEARGECFHAGWRLGIPGGSQLGLDQLRSGSASGSYSYEYRFCLCQSASKLTLVLDYLADNSAKVFLNGTQVQATTGIQNFKLPIKNYTYSGGVGGSNPAKPGINVIKIEVSNDSGVTGLLAKLKLLSPAGGYSAVPSGAAQ
jgi:hypothetical protein